MEQLGPRTVVVFITVRVNRPWEKSSTSVIEKAVGRWPNARIADWWRESAGRDEWFGRDGVHLTSLGARELANLVQRAIANDDAR